MYQKYSNKSHIKHYKTGIFINMMTNRADLEILLNKCVPTCVRIYLGTRNVFIMSFV